MDEQLRKDIRAAFLQGELEVTAVDPSTGSVGQHVVSDVMRHRIPHKKAIRLTLADGQAVTTSEDHSLFVSEGRGVAPIRADQLQPQDSIILCLGDVVQTAVVECIETVPMPDVMYDLSVPGPQNFVLSNGILAHNSYSIGGISLDIEKSSKYEGIKSNAEGQLDKAVESKMMTVKFMRGLQQPRFSAGVRSSFGPAVRPGVMSPRNYIGVLLGVIAAQPLLSLVF